MLETTTTAQRTALRRLLGYDGDTSIPIVVVAGDGEPVTFGRAGHYETKTGILVRHPNAYRAAWGKPIYVRSTFYIQIGADWLRRAFPQPCRRSVTTGFDGAMGPGPEPPYAAMRHPVRAIQLTGGV